MPRCKVAINNRKLFSLKIDQQLRLQYVVQKEVIKTVIYVFRTNERNVSTKSIKRQTHECSHQSFLYLLFHYEVHNIPGLHASKFQ